MKTRILQVKLNSWEFPRKLFNILVICATHNTYTRCPKNVYTHSMNEIMYFNKLNHYIHQYWL